jgi:hypothetical protein
MDPAQPPYRPMERELAFKLLASHALVDAEFQAWLREDPVSAAAQLHIQLTDKDLEYLRGIVEWDRIDENAKTIRDSLHLDSVVNSSW